MPSKLKVELVEGHREGCQNNRLMFLGPRKADMCYLNVTCPDDDCNARARVSLGNAEAAIEAALKDQP